MSSKHAATAFVLFVCMTTLPVRGGSFKRHYNTSSDARNNRANYRGEASETRFAEQTKYRCISKCMDEEEPVTASLFLSISKCSHP